MTKAYMLIVTKHGKTRLVLQSLKKFEEIVEIDEIYGRFDLICKMETESNDKLREFIQNKVNITEHIKTKETLIVTEEDNGEEEVVVEDF